MCGNCIPGPHPTRRGSSQRQSVPVLASITPETQWLPMGEGHEHRGSVEVYSPHPPSSSSSLTPQCHENGKEHRALVVEELCELQKRQATGVWSRLLMAQGSDAQFATGPQVLLLVSISLSMKWAHWCSGERAQPIPWQRCRSQRVSSICADGLVVGT